MNFGPRLQRAFFERPCERVARDLIGTVLVHDLADAGLAAGRIVETEAYLGEGLDPASHAHAGRTQRSRSMFDAPGRIYAYRSYGVHTCVNLVCDAEGAGSAVLLRAVEPLLGLPEMGKRRGLAAETAPPRGAGLRKLASGPGRLAQAFGFELAHDGVSVLRGPIAVREPGPGADSSGWPLPDAEIEVGPRVGISRAAERAYRFWWKGHPLVSPWRPGRRRGR